MSTLIEPNSIPPQSSYILPSTSGGSTARRDVIVADADYKIERLFLEFARVAAAVGVPGGLNQDSDHDGNGGGTMVGGLTMEEVEGLLQGDRMASIENKSASSPGNNTFFI
jgi:hypothetical protein